ncbi:glycoside hydrolase family 9 protein [Latilactobacillus sakei]
MTQSISQLLKATNQLHSLLPLDESQSLDQALVDQPVQESLSLPLIGDQLTWAHRNRGQLVVINHGFQITSPARYDSWAPGDPEDGDYVGFGEVTGYATLQHEDWQAFQQLSFNVEFKGHNIINPSLTIALKNDGAIKLPDKYNRDGFHSLNLHQESGKRRYCVPLSGLPRDAITELSFTGRINGSYADLPGELNYHITDIRLEKTRTDLAIEGWIPTGIVYSHTGYSPASIKTALIKETNATEFQIWSQQEQRIMTDQLTTVKSSIGQFKVADFSALTMPGTYQLRIGNQQTDWFTIQANTKLWTPSILKALNFIYSERCGFPVPGIHPTCHFDVTAEHNDHLISFNGGWHDAGDLSQQLIQTAEVTLSLFEAANDAEPALAQRLIEEGNWGIDFILKTDFQDGYHATSAGVSRWTNNQIGDMDDAKARVHNNPLENYLLAGTLATVAAQLAPIDPQRQRLLDSALNDYHYAEEVFKSVGYQKTPIFWEHTYNTSKATYLAVMAWSAGQLAARLNDTTLASQARQFMTDLLACQESVGLPLNDGTILKGMFYRDETHQIFQHFNHQSREHYFSLAFETLLNTQPGATEAAQWRTAARQYGDYLKYLADFTAPYPMLANGIYQLSEGQDNASFNVQHLLIDDSAKADYAKQLANGVQIGDGLYIKRFPVWFSFRGNNGTILSAGKAAAILGNLLDDADLKQIGINQLNWIVGYNPFGQSLMYGEGHHYTQQYAESSGDVMGEIPVGIETTANEDAPYWPHFNNATYKEVWIGNVGKWLSLVAEITKKEH